MDANTERNKSICQAKLLVHTSNMSLVNHRILVQTKNACFEVWVKESMPNTLLIRSNHWLRINLEETDEGDNTQSDRYQDEDVVKENILEEVQGDRIVNIEAREFETVTINVI